MTTNANEFIRELASFTTGLTEEPNNIKRKIALQAQRFIVLATPVDTGRARANWAVSLRTPIRTASEDKDKSGGRTIGRGSREILGAKPGETIYITNNLPYIQRLNDGSSDQAPAKFVEIATKAAIESVSR